MNSAEIARRPCAIRRAIQGSWGVEPPSFEVVTGSLWVTFQAEIGPGSSKQRCRTTGAGRRVLDRHGDQDD